MTLQRPRMTNDEDSLRSMSHYERDQVYQSSPQQEAQSIMTTTLVEKSGAGLLLCSEGEMLLLLRSASSGNPLKWGLPGGNIDEGESPIEAARREATEELGEALPPYTVLTEIHTKRGKRKQKHYVVFVASLSSERKRSFVPKLNKEHVEYRWFPMNEIPQLQNPHPVVQQLFSEHRQQVDDALQTSQMG